MLLILRHDLDFETLTQWGFELGFELSQVRACVFPSRPEPSQALWTWQEVTIWRYTYEPDLEVRALWRELPWPRELAQVQARFAQEHAAFFEDWDSLHRSLTSTDYATMCRAVSAWRLRALHGETAKVRAQAQGELLRHLEQSDNLHTQRVIAEQLYTCATAMALPLLERLSQESEDLEVRLHSRRVASKLKDDAALFRHKR